jgi:hypothetical protein
MNKNNNKEEVSICCGAERSNTNGLNNYCGRCGKPFLSPQEPMEWDTKKEFLKFIEERKIPWGQYAKTESILIADWFLSQIKQAEERGFQKGKDWARDMANNGWIPDAIQTERNRIVKEIGDSAVNVDKNESTEHALGRSYERTRIITLINQNNE